MDEREQNIKYIKEQIMALPEEAQRAICWLIENIDLVNQITQGEEFTKEEIKIYIQKALETKDYIMLIMVIYKQIKDQLETETMQQES